MDALLWVLAVAMMLVGVAGTVLPALPGVLLVLAGIVLAAWIDEFQKIGPVALGLCTLMALAGVALDYVASTVAAQRAGASKYGLIGAALGTVAGIFAGLVGVFVLPLVGAAIGEFIAHRDALRAGRVGIATWLGLLAGTVAKLAIVFSMIGVFAAALLID
ncbi:MAG: DUF456 domain-containing protein [Betaproteobacteria bacterium]